MEYIKYIGDRIDKKWIKSFKQLGNSPISITKYDYLISVLPQIENFYITDKTEGERCFLIINSTKAIYITSRETKDITELLSEFPEKECIYDCELVKLENSDSGPKMYIFDVIVSDGMNVHSFSFKERYKLIKVSPILNVNIRMKEFIPLSISTYQNIIMRVYNSLKDKPYETDGIIFTSINESYNKTINYKWKPPGKLTIDFLLANYQDGQYLLLVGIARKMFDRFALTITQDEKTAINKIPGLKQSCEYFPVPFKNSLVSNYIIPQDILTKLTKEKDLGGKIVEMTYENNQWHFYKIREDRQKEISTGSYFGNNYKVAEQTLQSILNPLNLVDLIANYYDLSKNVYFQKKGDDDFKFVKKFNNFVKKSLINRYKTNSAIDLASGRGGDLNKYFDAKYKNLLMIEIDKNSIDEIINRKYEILMGKNDGSLNLLVESLDLNKSYKYNISQLEKRNIWFLKNDQVNIFCHFAFHYFTESEKSLKNICEFINFYLKPGSHFIITILNGQKVFDLIKNLKEWKTDKYLIQEVSMGKIFHGLGNKIKIKLPFSNEIYDEYLIDLLTLDVILAKYKIFRTEDRNFDKLLDEYSIYNEKFYSQLDYDDKKFISMYKYIVYTKK